MSALPTDNVGILASAIASFDIEDSSFVANNATAGGGVSLEDIAFAITILGSEFRENEASGTGGGAILANASSTCDIRIDDSVSRSSLFLMNRATLSGGAVDVRNGTSFTTVNANFTGNMAIAGGGISATNTGPVNVTANTFVRNSADFGGAGIFVDNTGSLPLFTDRANTFIDNNATDVENNLLVEGFTNP